MVVDDDLTCACSSESFLTERGYEAVTLGNARDAVERYQADRPAAVILDMVMPGEWMAWRRWPRSRRSTAKCRSSCFPAKAAPRPSSRR